MWSLDVDAPVPERMAAGLGLGLKASLFIYARKINFIELLLFTSLLFL